MRLVITEEIWPLKVRFESIVTPRSLTEVTGTTSLITKERYGDVTRQLRDKLPHPNQEKHGFLRIDQKVVSATLL